MPIADIADWMDTFGRPGASWYAKRLSANDTLANDSHQAGPYIPKEFLFELFPSLNRPAVENPDVFFNLQVDSHGDQRRIRAIWYNNRLRGGTRNEARLTNFGGRESALLNPDSTGALAVFAFVQGQTDAAPRCHVWVCGGDGVEAELIEERLGPVEPKRPVVWRPGVDAPRLALLAELPRAASTCRLALADIPERWRTTFPSGEEIIQKVIALRPPGRLTPDARLIKRRACEFEMFLSVEENFYMRRIAEGFQDIGSFVSLAQTILQSRKSRSGNSLELHVREVLVEEGLRAGQDFTHRPTVENGKKPDFVFPSQAAYMDPRFPAHRLRMLAAKTTCKDRWRQVVKEADRIPLKHLITLQEGVSEGQFREMQDAGVALIVPKGLHAAYPEAVRPHLIVLESFITEVRSLPL